MIEELMHWEVRSKPLVKLGKKIEDLNTEFCMLASTLDEGFCNGIVNMRRFRSVQKRIEHLREMVDKINIRGRDRQSYFDRLVLQEFSESLFAQEEFSKFFFTKIYNKEWGVRSFLNYCFLPRSQFERKDENNSAVAFLEESLRDMNYGALTKRENLMREIDMNSLNPSFSELEEMLIEHLPRLRKMIGDYNAEMGFESKEQIETQSVIVQEKEVEKIKERIRNLFGEYRGDIPSLIMSGLDRQLSRLRKKSKPLDEALKELVYEIVLTKEDYSAYDSSTKVMEINADRFYFYKEKKTGKIKVYLGDVVRSIGHENYHRLQSYFSRFMPEGLKDSPGEYSFTGRTIAEGSATVLEGNFMTWIENNMQRYGISKKDVEIAKLMNHKHFGGVVVRLLHSVYHREETPLEKNEDNEAHLRLAKISKVPVYADDDYLYNDSMPETYYYAHYLFGKDYVYKTLEELGEIEKERLGSLRKARNFLRRNEPIVIQGLLTGNWGWATHKDFFLKHYWPKARRLCD